MTAIENRFYNFHQENNFDFFFCVHTIHSFSHSKGESWQNVFPTCTTANEIALVDGLVQYNPKKRLTAAEVQCSIQKKKTFDL